MSVLFADAGDRLAINDAPVPGTGDFFMCGWFYLTSLPGGGNFYDLCGLYADETGSESYFSIAIDGSTNYLNFFGDDTDTETVAYALSAETWYYVYFWRAAGGNFGIDLFDDSTSTTPLGSCSGDDGADNLGSYDWLNLGRAFTGEDFAGQMVAWRLVNGVTLATDTQIRAESQAYDYVLGSGTLYGNWRLKDADADDDGTDDSSGNSNDFTNTGVANGSTTPTQLAAAASAAVGGAYYQHYYLSVVT